MTLLEAAKAMSDLCHAGLSQIEVTPADIRGKHERRLYVCLLTSARLWQVTAWALDDAGERSCIVGLDTQADLLAALKAVRA